MPVERLGADLRRRRVRRGTRAEGGLRRLRRPRRRLAGARPGRPRGGDGIALLPAGRPRRRFRPRAARGHDAGPRRDPPRERHALRREPRARGRHDRRVSPRLPGRHRRGAPGRPLQPRLRRGDGYSQAPHRAARELREPDRAALRRRDRPARPRRRIRPAARQRQRQHRAPHPGPADPHAQHPLLRPCEALSAEADGRRGRHPPPQHCPALARSRRRRPRRHLGRDPRLHAKRGLPLRGGPRGALGGDVVRRGADDQGGDRRQAPRGAHLRRGERALAGDAVAPPGRRCFRPIRSSASPCAAGSAASPPPAPGSGSPAGVGVHGAQGPRPRCAPGSQAPPPRPAPTPAPGPPRGLARGRRRAIASGRDPRRLSSPSTLRASSRPYPHRGGTQGLQASSPGHSSPWSSGSA